MPRVWLLVAQVIQPPGTRATDKTPTAYSVKSDCARSPFNFDLLTLWGVLSIRDNVEKRRNLALIFLLTLGGDITTKGMLYDGFGLLSIDPNCLSLDVLLHDGWGVPETE